MKRLLFSLVMLLGATMLVSAQNGVVKVKKYGAASLCFSSVEEWERVHRPVIYNFFEREVYGCVPPRQVGVSYELLRTDLLVGGKALCKQVAMSVEGMQTPILILIFSLQM